MELRLEAKAEAKEAKEAKRAAERAAKAEAKQAKAARKGTTRATKAGAKAPRGEVKTAVVSTGCNAGTGGRYMHLRGERGRQAAGQPAPGSVGGGAQGTLRN